ncbi:helix-hairpin-helix domain-containing protein [Streptomyces sp. NPDC049881]|uniref:helix-hairpin-helix domain-containing protein n=1 Tax=Streptomyces sp. NPDC049881 TaxID=3155778 RepID=UPI003428C497
MADGTEELLRMANVGPAVVRRLARVGVTAPADLRGRDPYEMYERLCALDGRRHDPCLLDTFLSVVDQADGGEPRPWWTYTQERKRHG